MAKPLRIAVWLMVAAFGYSFLEPLFDRSILSPRSEGPRQLCMDAAWLAYHHVQESAYRLSRSPVDTTKWRDFRRRSDDLQLAARGVCRCRAKTCEVANEALDSLTGSLADFDRAVESKTRHRVGVRQMRQVRELLEQAREWEIAESISDPALD